MLSHEPEVGGEMQVEAGVALQPSSDLRCLMGAVAVEDEVDLEVVGHLPLDARRGAS